MTVWEKVKIAAEVHRVMGMRLQNPEIQLTVQMTVGVRGVWRPLGCLSPTRPGLLSGEPTRLQMWKYAW